MVLGCFNLLDVETLINCFFQIDKMKVKFQTLRNLEAHQWQPFNSEESNLAEVPKKSQKAHVGAEISAIKVELPGKSSPGLSAFLAGKFL